MSRREDELGGEEDLSPQQLYAVRRYQARGSGRAYRPTIRDQWQAFEAAEESDERDRWHGR